MELEVKEEGFIGADDASVNPSSNQKVKEKYGMFRTRIFLRTELSKIKNPATVGAFDYLFYSFKWALENSSGALLKKSIQEAKISNFQQDLLEDTLNDVLVVLKNWFYDTPDAKEVCMFLERECEPILAELLKDTNLDDYVIKIIPLNKNSLALNPSLRIPLRIRRKIFNEKKEIDGLSSYVSDYL